MFSFLQYDYLVCYICQLKEDANLYEKQNIFIILKNKSRQSMFLSHSYFIKLVNYININMFDSSCQGQINYTLSKHVPHFLSVLLCIISLIED